MIGETIGHYRILAELGSGGMGVVYRAEDLKLGRPVALKFLADGLLHDPNVHDRFLREARAAAALNHPNICTIYEINDASARPYIAMELLEGQTLQQALTAGPLPLAQLLDLAMQVADALDAAHARGLVHRDIKPGNIFVTADGRAKVVDFGLAKVTGPFAPQPSQSLIETGAGRDMAVTRAGTTIGTVAYMSPEQARGEPIDARSDLFSFGLVLYEMATGQRAFDGATTAVVFDAILNRMPLPPSFVNPTVPSELEQVIACAIEKDPAGRYQRASDLGADLRRLRRASEPDVRAASAAFVPSARAAASPAWGVTPASGGIAARVGPQPVAGKRAWWHWPIFATLLGVLVGVGGGLAWWFTRPPAVIAGAPVLVTDFVNRTGDPDFDGTLKQVLTIKLEESPYLSVMPQQKVRDLLSLMARRPDDAVTPAVGREMCQRIGNGAMISGEIVRFGQKYLLTLAAESCATGDEIDHEEAQAARKDDVLGALGTALSSMRGRLGESLTSIRAHDKPIIEATTSSLAALKSFALGDRQRTAGRELESIPYYRAAVDADPQFALAWARLGTVYSNTGEDALSKQCYQKAFDLRSRASEHEKFYITSHYYRTVAGDLPRARAVYETWRQQYPHDTVPVHNLGIVLLEIGEFEQALQAFRDASAMDPHNRLAREVIADCQIGLGDFAAARKTAEREIADLGDSPQPNLMLYKLDYLTGDQAGMTEHARRLAGTALDLDRQAADYEIAMFEGRMNDARAILGQVAGVAASQDRSGYAESLRTNDIVSRALVGFTRDTRAEVSRMLAARPNENNVLMLAFALVLAGDPARARAVMEPVWPRLERAPTTTVILKPAFDGLVAVRQGRADEALEGLKPSLAWENRLKAGSISSDVRGQAYLALGDGRKAEAEFQKRIAARGLDPFSVSYVLAYLNVGRARALAGDVAGARSAYGEFFALWKNADPDIPALVQAKAEYAKLAH